VSAGVGEKRQLLHVSHHQKLVDVSLDPRIGSRRCKFLQNCRLCRASQNFSLQKAASERKASEVALCPGRNGPRAPAWIAWDRWLDSGSWTRWDSLQANVCKLTQLAALALAPRHRNVLYRHQRCEELEKIRDEPD